VSTLRHRWLLNNLPVLVQPRFDISNGNGFLAAFYDFPTANSDCCVLSLLFEGEASYEVRRQSRLNVFGSFLYRSHNYRLYSRTADINHLAFHGCSLDGGWTSLHTTDFAGTQQWSRGAKRRFLYFYSLMHHYDLELKAEAWRQWEDGGAAALIQRLQGWRQQDAKAEQLQLTAEQRIAQLLSASPPASDASAVASRPRRPVVWLTTANHMMAPYDSNCSMELSSLCFHSSYPVYAGSRETAERFARLCVRSKWTVFSFLPAAIWSPVNSRDRRERAAWQRLHHSAILNAHSNGAPVSQHETAETETEVETEQQKQLTVDGETAAVMARH
jgi:hypothetical protein